MNISFHCGQKPDANWLLTVKYPARFLLLLPLWGCTCNDAIRGSRKLGPKGSDFRKDSEGLREPDTSPAPCVAQIQATTLWCKPRTSSADEVIQQRINTWTKTDGLEDPPHCTSRVGQEPARDGDVGQNVGVKMEAAYMTRSLWLCSVSRPKKRTVKPGGDWDYSISSFGRLRLSAP